MALPLLVNGAECGPSNPLQSLTKRFDTDRGIQQDQFGAGRAGPSSSRETFRTRTPGFDNNAAASFFSTSPSPAAFDLSALQNALPLPHFPVATSSPNAIPHHHHHHHQQQQSQQQYQQLSQQKQQLQIQPHQQQHGTWATDFIQIQNSSDANWTLQQDATASAVHPHPYQLGARQHWTTPLGSTYSPGPVHVPTTTTTFPPVAVPSVPVIHADQSLWDREFLSQERSLAASMEPQVMMPAPSQSQVSPATQAAQQDELARTAGMLVEQVRDEMAANSKFQNSQFLSLMKQLRDGAVVVEGNQMVDVQGLRGGEGFAAAKPIASAAEGWASEFQAETAERTKGKERAGPGHVGEVRTTNSVRNFGGTSAMWDSAMRFDHSQHAHNRETGVEAEKAQEVPEKETTLDAYLREDNESYTQYWKEFHQNADTRGPAVVSAEEKTWDRLQSDWDRFEATSTGIKPIHEYQFQMNNPYLVGDSSRTRHHIMHAEGRVKGVYESVLKLEAAVQHDPMNASAWFELGVKQQENEREHEAMQALKRAVALDPAHLPAWLALAVSNTNDGNRVGTYTAIREWVERNEKYADVVRTYWAQVGNQQEAASTTEGYERLVGCLIAIAQSVSGEIDADMQIALAVLLNTMEDYEKAQDCFKTALAVRPDDWLLYNRVGATMANSGRAEEAIRFYYRALELNPAYIRARFNLGISCINLRRYEEAAHHIFDALVLQDSDGVRDGIDPSEKRGVTSGALWDSLRTTCMHMQRLDLAALCELRNVEGFASAFQQ